MFYLPQILTLITRKARYRPDIIWSSNSWVHNIFRVYELIFWRRYGIKAEMSSFGRWENGKWITGQVAHSFEALCALIETYIRDLLKFHIQIPIKIWVPLFSTNIPTQSPFLFAIGFDTSTKGAQTSGLTLTIAHTCTGSNLIILNGTVDTGFNLVTSVKYNTVALTQIGVAENDDTGNNGTVMLYDLVAPATGANNMIITVSNSADQEAGFNASYSGAAQSGQPDSHADNHQTGSTSTSFAQATTVVASNCWLVGVGSAYRAGGPGTYGSSQTARQSDTTTLRSGDTGGVLADSNATVGTGSQSLTFTCANASNWGANVASIAPVAVASVAMSTFNLLGIN